MQKDSIRHIAQINNTKIINLLVSNIIMKISRKFNLKRILSHCLFWLGFLFFYTSTKSDYVDYQSFLFVYAWKIFAQAVGAYVLIYIIIPNTLNKKKHVFFATLSLSWLYLVFTFLMLLKYYYLEPKFPGFFDYWLGHKMSITERLTSFKLIFGEFSFITYPTVIMGFIRFYKHQQRLSKIEEEKKSMELKILKSQLNPHFLFNTLNNLYTLTLKKDDKAPEVIAKLSEILDYILYRCNENYVFIDKEVLLLDNYISLEKLRYNEKRLVLNFNKEITYNTKISPLILLTFLENAFKHGVINEANLATIDISLFANETRIEFKIYNSKPQNETSSKAVTENIGLTNVKKQLNLMYPQKHILELEDTDTLFEVKLTLFI